jgi:hypothetical protein
VSRRSVLQSTWTCSRCVHVVMRVPRGAPILSEAPRALRGWTSTRKLPITAHNAVAVGSPSDLLERRMWAAMPHVRDDYASTSLGIGQHCTPKSRARVPSRIRTSSSATNFARRNIRWRPVGCERGLSALGTEFQSCRGEMCALFTLQLHLRSHSSKPLYIWSRI